MAEAKGEGSYHWLPIVVKVVTYWLAKLLDPQHSVLLSDEHQDFQVPYSSLQMTVDSIQLLK